MQPAQYILINSGSEDRTFEVVPSSAVLLEFPGTELDSVAMLNESGEYVSPNERLLIARHPLVQDVTAKYASTFLRSIERIGAAYFVSVSTAEGRDTLIKSDRQ